MTRRPIAPTADRTRSGAVARPADDGRVRLADVPDRERAGRARPRGRRSWPAGGRGCRRTKLHPAGYRIRRVKVSAGAGLPLPGPLYRLISRVAPARRARAAAAGRDRGASAAPSAARRAGRVAPPTTPTAPARPRAGAARSVALRAVPGGRRGGSPRSALVVRSQTKASRGGRARRRPVPRHGLHGHPGRARSRPPARAARSSTTRATSTSTPATSPGCRGRPARSSAGCERGWARRADRVITVNRPYAEVMAERWGVELPLDRPELLVPLRPAATRGRAASTRRSGLPPDTRVVLYQGGFSRDRGIEQLIEAIPSVDRRGPRAAGLRLAAGRARAAGGRPGARRPAPDPAGRPARRAARLGRLGRRRRDADPADDAQPPPDDAEQAVRGDGRRRAGGRERPAGHGRHRPRDRRGRARRPDRPGGDRRGDLARSSTRRPTERARVRRARARGRPRDVQLGAPDGRCSSPSTGG